MKKAPLNVRRGQVYLARLNGVGSEQRGKRPVVVIQNNTGNRFSPTISSSIKFEEMSEQWFNEYAILNLHNTTLVRTKQLTTRVYSALGYMKLDKITSRHIQQFITDLALNGRNFQTRKPLSRKTVIHHLSFISDVLSYAVKMGMISDNPCSRVTVPRGEQKEKGIYTLEEVTQLFSLVENEPMKYHTFFILSRTLKWVIAFLLLISVTIIFSFFQCTAVFAEVKCWAWSGRMLILKTILSVFTELPTTQRQPGTILTLPRRRNRSVR